MIKPLLQDEAFLEDVHAAAAMPEALHLWWLGQSGFLLQHQGRHLLLDPYLSDSLTAKYAATPTPHVRMTERVVSPDRLAFIEVVSSTHNHTDHLDAQTLLPLMKVNPQLAVVVSEANREFAARRLGVDAQSLVGLAADQSQVVRGFTISSVPAAHDQLESDERGNWRCVGFIVRSGPWTVYHSGDTVRFDRLAELLGPRRLDVVILPINGKLGNMDGGDAARLAHEVNARLVLRHF